MSVNAGGDKLQSFQVAKGHQKSKQTSTLKILIFLKISGNVGMTDWWKKYGDKGRDGTGSRTTSCPAVHKSHPHKYSSFLYVAALLY